MLKSALNLPKVCYIALITFMIMVLAVPGYSQNTKGDKPVSTRESRFKKPGKRVKAKRRDDSGQRAYIPRKRSKGGERAGRPIRPTYHDRTPSNKQRAWKGDITGRRIRARRASEAAVTQNVFQQPRSYVRRPKDLRRSDKKPPGKKRKVVPRSVSSRSRKFYPQSGRYVNNASRKPQRVDKARFNTTGLARGQRLQSSSDRRPGKKRRVTPRSASGSFIARKSTNTWAHFPRPKRKTEKAYVRDIAGKKLRTKNYETPRAGVITPTYKPYYGRKRVGDRPHQGTAWGKTNTATRPGRAWKGDITGRKIKGRNYSSKVQASGKPVFPPRKRKIRSGDKSYRGQTLGGFRTASKPGEKRTGKAPLPVKAPGAGADRMGKYQGNIKGKRYPVDQGEQYSGALKSRRRLKGGGSVSGKLWNNKRQPVPVRTPGAGADRMGKYQGNIKGRRYPVDQGEQYTGSIKARRKDKGGGSVSGKLWNNKRQPVPVRTPGVGADRIGKYQGNIKGRRAPGNQGEEYTGAIKTRRKDKGGGSVSGKLWNNKNQPVPVRTPGAGADRMGKYQGNIKGGRTRVDQGEEYTGSIKARRKDKGGGSVSGKLWNNKNQPVPVKTPGAGADRIGKYQGNIKGRKILSNQGEEYTGAIKTRRKEKGGGSVSGKLWNNKNQPVSVKTPGAGADRIGKYQGNVKGVKVMNDQGEEYTGAIKKRRPDKGGGSVSGKLWNNKETPVPVKQPSSSTETAASYQGNVKGRKMFVDQGEEFTGTVKLPRFKRTYIQNPNADDESTRKKRPDKSTYRVDDLQVKVKQYHYVKNPNSADDALKTREPGKAFARASDYQGNIKMQKFKLFEKNRELHPDARFVKINKNNVAKEKDMLTNFKLWWARLFRKNDTQPDHLKEKDKDKKPRYDKGEQGLWYE